MSLLGQTTQVHMHDREEQAKRLGLTLAEFDRLVASGNKAYNTLRELGPFYGREEIKEPTFRITANPVILPQGSYEILTSLGSDLLHLGRALHKLPESVKTKLGADLEYNLPPTWRIDVIIDENKQLKVNEIEGKDGANALMMAEQQAYGLQLLTESTAAKLIPTLKAMCAKPLSGPLKIALLRKDIDTDLYTPNTRRFIYFINYLSGNSIEMEQLEDNDIRAGISKPNWNEYGGVINEATFSPRELYELGITRSQIIALGNYNAMVNKGLFAAIFDTNLTNFWTEELGTERLTRLKNLLIPSKFITTEVELEKAHQEGKVVKVSWAGSNTMLINRSRGVAIPEAGVKQSTDERWDMLKGLLKDGMSIIAQDFIKPAKLNTFLRKRGTTLEPVSWYNRLCVKYVALGNPNAETIPSVALTAAEVTLGPDVVPAGRMCTFTAGAFE